MWHDDYAAPLLIANCVRCGGLFAEHPDKTPTVWINTITRCPVRPDASPIRPGEPGTTKEPLCHPCHNFLAEHPTGPVPVLFPRAHLDTITIPDQADPHTATGGTP